MGSVIKGYYDGSGDVGDANAGHLTLAGFAGTNEGWNAFERRWDEVMSAWRCPRPGDDATCAQIHMRDAYALRGEFSPTKGWTRQKVTELLIQIFNHCFGPVGYNDGLRAAAVTVDLSDYRRACSDFPDLAEVKPAPALCVDYVVSVAFAMLPLDDKGPHGRSGQVELVFDRNERFERTIRPVFDRRKGYHRLIAGVTSARSENTPALQAADILAWCANRGYAQGDSFFGIAPMLAAQSLMKLFGYDEIVKRYKMALDLRAASVGKID